VEASCVKHIDRLPKNDGQEEEEEEEEEEVVICPIFALCTGVETLRIKCFGSQESSDVIGHVTIRLAVCGFLLDVPLTPIRNTDL